MAAEAEAEAEAPLDEDDDELFDDEDLLAAARILARRRTCDAGACV